MTITFTVFNFYESSTHKQRCAHCCKFPFTEMYRRWWPSGAFLRSNREVPAILTEAFRSYPQSLHANAESTLNYATTTFYKIVLNPLFTVIPSFDDISKQLKASLNKPGLIHTEIRSDVRHLPECCDFYFRFMKTLPNRCGYALGF